MGPTITNLSHQRTLSLSLYWWLSLKKKKSEKEDKVENDIKQKNR